MTYKEFQDEVMLLRFTAESWRPSVKRWLDLRYLWLWNYADWSFKRISGAQLTLDGSSNTPTMPLDFAKGTALFNSNGDELPYLTPGLWEQVNAYPSSGMAESWTSINRQIHIGPKNVQGEQLSLSYERRLAHVDPVQGVIGGTMQADGDEPLWPAEHDYALVVDTIILGQQLNRDDGWRDLVPQRDELLRGMVADLVGDVEDQPIYWGATA